MTNDIQHSVNKICCLLHDEFVSDFYFLNHKFLIIHVNTSVSLKQMQKHDRKFSMLFKAICKKEKSRS